ncbi:MAG: hypothetical protein JO265_03430, partial [Acidimicrobiia bacterium]|nr:hypothetical protein [Acidimicrobiia bacterium]
MTGPLAALADLAKPDAVTGPLAALADLAKPDRPPGQVTRAVQRVLARPEYRHQGPSLLSRLRSDVLDWLARVLTGILGAGIGAWVAVAVIATVVGFVA